jgi:hypothetical protein
VLSRYQASARSLLDFSVGRGQEHNYENVHPNAVFRQSRKKCISPPSPSVSFSCQGRIAVMLHYKECVVTVAATTDADVMTRAK